MLSRISFAIRALLAVASLSLACPTPASATFDADAYRAVAATLSTYTSDPIVLIRPALLVDPVFSGNTPGERAFVSDTLDTMLSATLLYQPAGHMLGDVYADALANATWASLPLLPAQRQDLARLQQLLFADSHNTPTSSYQTYLSLKRAYDTLEQQYEVAQPSEVTPEFRNKLDQAEQDLRLKGNSPVYGPAESQYAALQSQASYKWRDAALQTATAAATVSADGKRHMATTTSVDLGDLEGMSWSHFTLTGGQLHHPSGFPRLGATVTDATSWWSFPNTVAVCPSHLTRNDFIVQFDAAIVTAKRPWLDETLFSSQAWKWSRPAGLLSDGRDDGNAGEAPAFPNAVIVVKEVTISGPSITPCLGRLRTAATNDETVSFGPFVIGGRAGYASARYLTPILTGQTIRVPYTQLLAFPVTVLPKSPNPNLDYQWPTP